MNHLVLIPPTNLPNVLSLVYPKIDAATAYSVGKYRGSDVVVKIAAGEMQLWAIVDEDADEIRGIAITEIAVYPQRKILRFLCATGEEFREWIDLIDEIEQWGADMGCSGFQAECRPGWERSLKERGYRKSHVILNKELGSWH
jgi:hypothetical protein